MKKRVFAWILLIGFVLLLANIMVFQFMLKQSFAVYIIAVVFFIMTGNKRQQG